MTDIVNKQTRSRMMSNIRSHNTKPEILTRKALHQLGYRFRLNSKVDNIKPDIVLRKHRLAVFVHGCYWHQHEGCKLAYSDRNYSDQWIKKFQDNKKRDKRVTEYLLSNQWRVAIIWECTTRNTTEFDKTIVALDTFIQDGKTPLYESSYVAL